METCHPAPVFMNRAEDVAGVGEGVRLKWPRCPVRELPTRTNKVARLTVGVFQQVVLVVF